MKKLIQLFLVLSILIYSGCSKENKIFIDNTQIILINDSLISAKTCNHGIINFPNEGQLAPHHSKINEIYMIHKA